MTGFSMANPGYILLLQWTVSMVVGLIISICFFLGAMYYLIIWWKHYNIDDD